MSRNDLPPVRAFPSLTRPILLGGLEREIAIPLVGLVLGLLLAFRLNWVTPALAAAVVFVLVPYLRRATRRDPRLWQVLRCHLDSSGFYPAVGRPTWRRRAPKTF